MELMEIPVEDIHPDEKNPRKDFGDIAALAESCMLNALNPGEPVNPIVVVRDGGIYRIVDGERRYKAMCKNKLKRCHAVVCEDLDEANAMVAMVATDDKRQLTEIERSRGVQQMLLLGVDPERVERAGRLPKGSAARVSRARQAVDDAGDDMTLDRMLAIAEFDEAGDEEAVERLTNCREAEWQNVADRIKEQRAKEGKIAALKKACEEVGIELAEGRPISDPAWKWSKDASDPGEIAATAEQMPEGYAAYLYDGSYQGPLVEFYRPAEAEKANPEKAERRVRLKTAQDARIASETSRLAWFHERIGDLDSMPNVMEHVEDAALAGYDGVGKHVDDYEKAVGSEIDRSFCPVLAAYGYRKASKSMELVEWIVEELVDGDVPSYRLSVIGRFVEWLEAFEADGYEPAEADLVLKRLCEAELAGDEEEEDDEGEEQE